MVPEQMKPPFHAEHIGSLVRPPRLIDAARAHKAGKLDDAGFRAVQDDCIREIVAFQESLGLPSVTDGEFRRASWHIARAGSTIPLTPKEYALLEFLAFHRGKVATRSMIWEHLYDEQDESTSNVVDVYIRYLRNKIDKGFDPPLILTRWGEGYLLRGDDKT